MSSLEDRLAARRQQATEAAQAVAAPPPPAESPAHEPAAVRPAAPASTRQRVEAPPQEPAELSREERALWRQRLGAVAGKLAADQRRADTSARSWARVVAEARAGGVPERLLMAAALEADVDLPAAE